MIHTYSGLLIHQQSVRAYLQWTSSGVRTPGNEKSDILTNVGAAPQPDVNMMLTSMKKNNGTVMNNSPEAYLKTSQQRQITQGPHQATQLPKQVTVATFRLATAGHDKLQAHLHMTDGNQHQCPVGNNGRMYARHL